MAKDRSGEKPRRYTVPFLGYSFDLLRRGVRPGGKHDEPTALNSVVPPTPNDEEAALLERGMRPTQPNKLLPPEVHNVPSGTEYIRTISDEPVVDERSYEYRAGWHSGFFWGAGTCLAIMVMIGLVVVIIKSC